MKRSLNFYTLQICFLAFENKMSHGRSCVPLIMGSKVLDRAYKMISK